MDVCGCDTYLAMLSLSQCFSLDLSSSCSCSWLNNLVTIPSLHWPLFWKLPNSCIVEHALTQPTSCASHTHLLCCVCSRVQYCHVDEGEFPLVATPIRGEVTVCCCQGLVCGGLATLWRSTQSNTPTALQ